MSFPRYPKYKASGVEWLGEVPEGWGVSRLKWSVTELYSGGTPESGNPEYWSDEDEESIPWVAIGDMTGAAVVETTEKRITPAGLASKRLRVLPKGTLLYSMYATLGKVSVLGVPATVNQAILGIVPDSGKANQAYLRYWLIQVESHLELFSSSNTQDNLNAGKVRSLPLLVPTLIEQVRIASFLDRETAKIDALVAEQRRLIDLLKEKRQAVISHAVAKGLNPHAPMKLSGVEWLGEVPAHWDVTRMKWIAKMESGHTPDKKIPKYWDGDIPWVSLNDTGYLKDNDYVSDTAYRITEEGIAHSSAHLLPPRAVVFSRDATIGRCAITTRPMAVSQHFIAWVCGDSMVPEYLLLRLRSMTGELDRLTTGATVKTIGMPEVRTLVTPVPPLAEQQAIVAWVSEEAERLDTLTAEAQRAIDLLQERRTALISAAVTGKIDVRRLVETEAA